MTGRVDIALLELAHDSCQCMRCAPCHAWKLLGSPFEMMSMAHAPGVSVVVSVTTGRPGSSAPDAAIDSGPV